MIKQFLCVMAAVFLVSCTRLEIITDQYWKVSFVDDLEINSRLVKIVEMPAEGGRIPDLCGAGLERLPENVLLSPFYSPQAAKLAEMYPGKRFFYFSNVFPGNGKAAAVPGTEAVSGMEGSLEEDRKRMEILIDSILKNNASEVSSASDSGVKRTLE